MSISINGSPEANLPPAPWIPKPLQQVAFLISQRWTVRQLTSKYGPIYVFGRIVVVADPMLAKQVFNTSTEILGNIQPNLSKVFGPGSVFGQEGMNHRIRRKVLAPPFHGFSIREYETIVLEETLREVKSWPESVEFRTLDPMNRITLNVILRAVFGANGSNLDRLRELIPPLVKLGSRLWPFPKPKRNLGRLSPWRKYDTRRREFDEVVGDLIDQAFNDPKFDRRTDVLARLLHSTYDDGSTMSRDEIGDELLTLLAAGHETTASAISWAFERLCRHPTALAALSKEAQTEANDLRQAAITEVLRTRPVIGSAARQVLAQSAELGEWRIPHGYWIIVSISHIHTNETAFPNPNSFDIYRFLDRKPPTSAWIPFGGGTRRCVGAALANMEMDLVLRTILRNFTILPTSRRSERPYSRGVAHTPSRGGAITVRRRLDSPAENRHISSSAGKI